MKSSSRNMFIFAIFAFGIIGVCFYSVKLYSTKEFKNIILIGWDGAQREHLVELLSDGQLPNLEKLINEGGLVYTKVTTGATKTVPGWAEILTGYSAAKLGILNNKIYKPIPFGFTIFERLETHFGEEDIVTIFIGGRRGNIGSRGQHKICINCITRDPVTRRRIFKLKIFPGDEKTGTAPTKDYGPEQWVIREGEPYFNSKKAIDFYLTGLGSAKNVGNQAISLLSRYHDKPFFAFFHFEEPDQQGHFHGENSPEYTEGMKEADCYLGVILEKLKALGIYNKTTIFVTSDHGMEEGGFGHKNDPDVFLATNSKAKLRDGDRKDITPTILEEYGIDSRSIKPPLDGKSLFTDIKSKK